MALELGRSKRYYGTPTYPWPPWMKG
jgi:hypothetical protein